MKSQTTEEPGYGSQFIGVLKSRNALYVAGSLTLFASLALGVALVSANAQTPHGEIATSLTVEQARAIVAPLYEALNEPTKKDVPPCWRMQPTLTTNPVRPTRIVCHVIN